MKTPFVQLWYETEMAWYAASDAAPLHPTIKGAKIYTPQMELLERLVLECRKQLRDEFDKNR